MLPASLFFTDAIFFFLSFDNGWTGRNADCSINTVDEKVTTAINLVNIGPVTP